MGLDKVNQELHLNENCASDENISSFELEATIESLIFVSVEPLPLAKIRECISSCNKLISDQEIQSALYSLMNKWSDENRIVGRGMSLKKLGGGYIFATSQQNSEVVKKLVQVKPYKLTKAQVEVLSIVAYRQPITRIDVDEVRGVDSSAAIKRLCQVNLVKILGKSEGLGRPLLYGTTKKFLEMFELNSLHELPTLQEFESLSEGEIIEPSLEDENITVKDLFDEAKKSPMFSEKTEAMSNDAMTSLNDALGKVEAVRKSVKENEKSN
jgi:segregation and condensation protein B